MRLVQPAHSIRRDKRIFSTGCAGKSVSEARLRVFAIICRLARWLRSGRGVDGGDSDENAKLTDCYYDKKDWRLCKEEVGRFFEGR